MWGTKFVQNWGMRLYSFRSRSQASSSSASCLAKQNRSRSSPRPGRKNAEPATAATPVVASRCRAFSAAVFPGSREALASNVIRARRNRCFHACISEGAQQSLALPWMVGGHPLVEALAEAVRGPPPLRAGRAQARTRRSGRESAPSSASSAHRPSRSRAASPSPNTSC
jgi:hypothetical protein